MQRVGQRLQKSVQWARTNVQRLILGLFVMSLVGWTVLTFLHLGLGRDPPSKPSPTKIEPPPAPAPPPVRSEFEEEEEINVFPFLPPRLIPVERFLPCTVKTFVQRPHFHKKYVPLARPPPPEPTTEAPVRSNMPVECYTEAPKPLVNWPPLLDDVYDAEGRVKIPLIWLSPLMSGGGYCTEGISFVQHLKEEMNNIKLVQWGSIPNIQRFTRIFEIIK